MEQQGQLVLCLGALVWFKGRGGTLPSSGGRHTAHLQWRAAGTACGLWVAPAHIVLAHWNRENGTEWHVAAFQAVTAPTPPQASHLEYGTARQRQSQTPESERASTSNGSKCDVGQPLCSYTERFPGLRIWIIMTLPK